MFFFGFFISLLRNWMIYAVLIKVTVCLLLTYFDMYGFCLFSVSILILCTKLMQSLYLRYNLTFQYEQFWAFLYEQFWAHKCSVRQHYWYADLLLNKLVRRILIFIDSLIKLSMHSDFTCFPFMILIK